MADNSELPIEEDERRIERIQLLAKFIALANISSGPDFSKREDLDALLEKMDIQKNGNLCVAYNVYGFLERKGWL